MKHKSIVSVTETGLTYRDSRGGIHFIDFDSCRDGFSLFLQQQNGFSEKQRLDVKLRTKCVAVRDAFAKPMYIEFLCEPPVRFEFRKKLFHDPYPAFRKLNSLLQVKGWSALDLG